MGPSKVRVVWRWVASKATDPTRAPTSTAVMGVLWELYVSEAMGEREPFLASSFGPYEQV